VVAPVGLSRMMIPLVTFRHEDDVMPEKSKGELLPIAIGSGFSRGIPS
jgi:hypothetical protein